MTNVLILAAGGQIARHVVDFLKDHPSLRPTLFLRDAERLKGLDTLGMRVIESDITDTPRLRAALAGQDIVYANVSGDMDGLAQRIINAMTEAGVGRLIFVTSLGIYDEVPGAFGDWNRREIGAYLPPYRRAADLIEASGLDYTLLRPAWLTDNDEISYETTDRHQPFKGTAISRKSVAAFIIRILEDPTFTSRQNLGLNKPGTDGDKPAFL